MIIYLAEGEIAMISIVAAMDSKRGIGKNNRIPWHITEDLIHLKNLTKDKIVILGRKTYESMEEYYDKSGRPLPGRLYLVVTRDSDFKPTRENAKAVSSIEEAVKTAGDQEAFVIGGAQIFEQTLPFADKLYLTVVDGDFGADTFFPDYSEFTKVLSEQEGQEGEYHYKFIDLGR